MRRRSYILGAGAVVATSLGQIGTGTADANGAAVETYVIASGTPSETEVSVISSGDGPTTVVTGGIHGDERVGVEAAARIVERWRPASGSLVVVPRANVTGIEADRRGWARGTDDWADLNRQFPAGEEPPETLPSAIWSLLDEHDPGYLIDLHSAYYMHGRQDGSRRSVGQALFRSPAGGDRDRVLNRLNERYDLANLESHDGHTCEFVAGNDLGTSDSPLFLRKAGVDRGVEGFLLDTYRADRPNAAHSLDDEVEWALTACAVGLADAGHELSPEIEEWL
ncbi:succinylglutamate desuccinylase/aspartoacylase family protein [Natronorarus salvus]|uniref:succinylglutamate desuccinylase/aspartoacylase family protein n=1 Tax=Natronorarus salvus TaxID=3117733 RepID=UPI002F26A598